MTDRLLHLDMMPVQKTEKSNLMSIINILRYLTETLKVDLRLEQNILIINNMCDDEEL